MQRKEEGIMTAHNQSAGHTKEQILALWEEKLNSLFPGGVPSDYVWSERADILRVLVTIGEEDLNELLFPDGGGLDLTGAADSVEADCIELHFGSRVDIVKPERLAFHSFGPMWEWAYFRLDTLPLEPTGIYEPSDQLHEEVLEVAPGEYVDSAVLYAGATEAAEADDSLPALDTARRVIRHLRGSFAIFPKRARYMTVLGAYDGRHDKTDDAQFNEYVGNAVEKLRQREQRKGLAKR
jgi:hypothetical protein